MTVNKMLEELKQLADNGYGDFEFVLVNMKEDNNQLFGFENELFIPNTVEDICYSEHIIRFEIETYKPST